MMKRAGVALAMPSPALATTVNWVGVEHAMTAHNDSTPPTYYKAHPRLISYRFGTDGSIWSTRLAGAHPRKKARTWRRLSPMRMKKGHVRAHVIAEDGTDQRILLHRLVLETFVGPCPPGMEGCHYDGDPANNRLGNLRWDTREGNRADDRRNGKLVFGTRMTLAKLNDDDIPVIRALIAQGVGNTAIGRRFGVNPMTIHAVRKGRTWRHVPHEQAPDCPELFDSMEATR